MKIRHIFALALAAITSGSAAAAEPSGYYDSCKGKGGSNLLTALCSKISSHTNVGYDGLYNVYEASDVHPDGTVWDMYSTKNWGTWSRVSKCGSYKNVGDCINREHSVPQSWFKEASPMKSDAFHVYPTDGKVNGQRGNDPYGECAGGTTLSNGSIKGLGRLGASTFPGYSGRVFEPDDQYKGDFARSYFYMAACYNDRISSWSSPAFAGNSYPVFTSWTVNLLLKWHRQDPVSDKEIDRNEAVYAKQKNRNPFIDHPELAEYIWGDKKTSTWNGSDEPAGSFTLPVNGSTVDMGVAGSGVPVSTTITVRGKDLTSAVSVSATNALQLSATTISASQANAGYELTLTWKLSQVGSYTSKLTLTSGSAKTEVTVKARVQEGLPATAATEIAAESFRANWTYVGDAADGKYTLDVKQGAASIDGYPRKVDAATGHYTVDGLEPATAYTYTLKSDSHTSNTVSVTTGVLLPSVQFLYDGELAFNTTPGEPSAAEELLVEIENISSAVAVSVSAPFQISTDRTEWGTSLTLQPAEDRIYMRLNADRAGTFSTSISAKAGDYSMSSGLIYGYCQDAAADFLETFEANFAKPYSDGLYVGSAANWTFANVGVVGIESQGDRIYEGEKACRFGKKEVSSIAMDEDKLGGAGTVSFYACRWINNQGDVDPAAVIEVSYSTDGGSTWTPAGTVNIDASQYTQYSVPVNKAGNVRVKLARTVGSRIHLDNVAISNYTTGLNDPTDEYYSWDAYSPAAGTLCIESRDAATAAVHGIDGITYIGAAALAAGTNTFELPAGLYIVVVGRDTRRVLVK